MNAWQVNGPRPEALKLVEIAKPQVGPGEVLVRVRAVSLNYRDRLMIENNGYARHGLPFIPCSDLAGIVEAVGEGVTRFDVGDRVINNFNGGWIDGPPPRVDGEIASFGGPLPGVLAEYVALPAQWLVEAPAALSYAQASVLPCIGLTAWTSLVELGRLSPGQTVVVQGTGGFSLFALQLASGLGAEVIATTTDSGKAERARTLGARHVIDRATNPDWAAGVLEITGGRGADHILEVAGGANLGHSIRALAPAGRVSLIGVMEGFESNFPSVPAIHAFATIQAVFVGHRRGLENLVRAVDAMRLQPVIDSEFEFSAFSDALDRLRQGPLGKVVVRT